MLVTTGVSYVKVWGLFSDDRCLVSQVCRWVLKYKTSKNPLIQMTILNLLPRLAAFQPHTFTGKVYHLKIT